MVGETKLLWTANGYVSLKTYQRLRALSLKMKVPMTSLVARAIANEFACDNPFNRKLNIDHIPWVDENTEDTQKLFKYVGENGGLGLEHYLILADVIGIESEEKLLIAMRQLIKIDMITGIRPRSGKFNFPDDYRVYFVNRKAQMERAAKIYRPIKGPLNEIVE